MMHRTLFASVVAGALALAAAAAAQAQTAESRPDEPAPTFTPQFLSDERVIATGREVWQQQCRHCHGNSAYPGKAPKLSPGRMEPDFIFDRVTYGFKAMPPWRDVFTREQRLALVAYIKSGSFSP
jgi:mono/diheme cytochrome c family protein